VSNVPGRVLVVGAGAVGVAYAAAFAAAGVEVHAYVKPGHVAALRAAPPVLTRIDGGVRRVAVSFAEVHTAADTVAGVAFDAIVLAVASPALAGAWLDGLLAASGEATILSLQPGLHDKERLLALLPPGRLVRGIIPFLAWSEPLPGEPPGWDGVRLYVPPLARTPLQGADPARVARLVGWLRAGGQPAVASDAVDRQIALGAALLASLILCLELAGWSLRAVDAALAASAAREAVATAAAHRGEAPPPWIHLLHGPIVRVAAHLAPALMPLPLEAYLRSHFTKVGAQTAASLDDLRASAATRGEAVPALGAVALALQARRAAR